jgi:peroxiredoxin Q/BCP
MVCIGRKRQGIQVELKSSDVEVQAPEFKLKDQIGKEWTLGELTQNSAVMLVFYPGDFTPVCTKQLCNYRDSMESFKRFPIRLVGISTDNSESHQKFSKEYHIDFPLLSDPEHKVAKAYGCTSLLMLGGVSRAVVIVNKKRKIVYRHVEPTALTRRKADELLGVIQDLKSKGLID